MSSSQQQNSIARYVSPDIWYQILDSLEENHLNILFLLKSSQICKTARAVFLSDYAWRALNPYGLQSGIAAHFGDQLRKLDQRRQREMYLVWQLAGSKWDWADYYADHGIPYGVPQNLYHRLAIVSFVENNYEFSRETNFHLMKCAVQLNPVVLRKVSTDMPPQEYKQLVMLALCKKPDLYEELPQSLRKDIDVARAVLDSPSTRSLLSQRSLTVAQLSDDDFSNHAVSGGEGNAFSKGLSLEQLHGLALLLKSANTETTSPGDDP